MGTGPRRSDRLSAVSQALPPHRRLRRGFTLVELLVVLSIAALLMAILLPSLRGARHSARSVVCKSNLRNLMTGIGTYAAYHADFVVPSYNMRGVSSSRSNPLDGWGPILHKEGIILGNDTLKQNPFVCPNTANVAGMSSMQTGADPTSPNRRGYMDWPAVVSPTGNYSIPMPRQGYDKIIRVAYWINGDNLIGRPTDRIRQGVHFTGSVGYGPDSTGAYVQANRFEHFKSPARLIALADGLYSGNQEATRLADLNSRIGYRHPRRGGTANVGFADGHADEIAGNEFPRKAEDMVTLEQARQENLGTAPTIFSDPERFLGTGAEKPQ